MPLPALNFRYSADLWSNCEQSVVQVDRQGRSNPIPAQQWSVLYMKWKSTVTFAAFVPEFMLAEPSYVQLWFLMVNDQGWSDLRMYWLLVAFSLCKALNERVCISHIFALKTKQPEHFLFPAMDTKLPRKTVLWLTFTIKIGEEGIATHFTFWGRGTKAGGNYLV